MKNTAVLLISIIAFLGIFIFSCEEEEIEEVKNVTNKLTFKEIRVDSVSYRMFKISWILENLNKNSIDDFGICYNTSGEPTLEDNTIKIPPYSSGNKSIEGLSPNTKYYFRLFAEIGDATVFSNEDNFSTNPLGTPAVLTHEITDTTTNSAICGGEVTERNGGDVTARGVCWNKSGAPIVNDNKTNDGTGLGSFISNMDNLEINTTYYVRAYATNDAGTSYGEEKSFTTEDGLPELTTNGITNIDSTSATSGGNINDNGGFDITARGVCWSTSQNPTVSDNHTNDGTGTGSFTSELTGLTEGTTYYVRAYATNSAGTAYGEEKVLIASELIAYYPFNETANDESGNGNNGTTYGNLNYIDDRFGNQLSAIHLDGVDDKIVIPNLQIRFPWSISFWTGNLETETNYAFITDHWDSYWADYHGFMIIIDNEGKVRGGFGNGPGYATNMTKHYKTLNSVIGNNNWYHIALTFQDYNNISIYINGSEVETEIINNESLSSISYQNEDVEIGADDYDTGERYWKGKLDDIIIFNKALSESEIQYIYNNGKGLQYP